MTDPTQKAPALPALLAEFDSLWDHLVELATAERTSVADMIVLGSRRAAFKKSLAALAAKEPALPPDEPVAFVDVDGDDWRVRKPRPDAELPDGEHPLYTRAALPADSSQGDSTERCGKEPPTAGMQSPSVDALQARIDELMLEYCPDEMTPEQIENWGRNQRHGIEPDFKRKL